MTNTQKEHLIREIQHRLLKNCGLASISKVDKKGILHLFIAEAIHLGYILKSLTENAEDLYLMILEDMSKNWIRYSAPINTEIQLDKIK